MGPSFRTFIYFLLAEPLRQQNHGMLQIVNHCMSRPIILLLQLHIPKSSNSVQGVEIQTSACKKQETIVHVVIFLYGHSECEDVILS